ERAEWMQLPGIGEILASRILASREAHGPFTRHDDLLRVSGIGPKTLAKLKPFLLPLPEPPPSAPARE
ncbi:MAG TPA: helix-hairpin-helix domain-containing protein, partial [Pirellulales bacterium]